MEKYFQQITKEDHCLFSLLRYSLPTRTEILIEYIFSCENCTCTRTDISKKVFKKNLPSIEIDFYKEGLERRGIIKTFVVVSERGQSIEYWQLSQE